MAIVRCARILLFLSAALCSGCEPAVMAIYDFTLDSEGGAVLNVSTISITSNESRLSIPGALGTKERNINIRQLEFNLPDLNRMQLSGIRANWILDSSGKKHLTICIETGAGTQWFQLTGIDSEKMLLLRNQIQYEGHPSMKNVYISIAFLLPGSLTDYSIEYQPEVLPEGWSVEVKENKFLYNDMILFDDRRRINLYVPVLSILEGKGQRVEITAKHL